MTSIKEKAPDKTPRKPSENGRRSGIDQREFTYHEIMPDRRSDKDRRKRRDRRKKSERKE